MRFRGILRGGDVEKLTDWLHDSDLSTIERRVGALGASGQQLTQYEPSCLNER